MRVGHVARAVGPNREQIGAVETGRDKQQSVRKHWPRHHRVALAIAHPPDFAAILRVERPHRTAPRRDDLDTSIHADHERRAERKIRLHRDPARHFPRDLAGGFFERDDKGILRAIGVEHEPIARERRRAAIAVQRIVAEGVVPPKNFPSPIQTRGAVVAEVQINPISLDDRGRAGRTIFRVHGLHARFSRRKNFRFPQRPPARHVERQRAQRHSTRRIRDSRREKNTTATDRGRRPTRAGHGYLPRDIFGR